MAKRAGPTAPQRLILDAGAVIALSRSDIGARAAVAAAIEAAAVVSVPAVVIAETVRGHAPDAPVNRVLKAIGVVDEVHETTGRIAGRLLGAASSSETIDALVVATAVELGGAVVLTGDRRDMQALAAGHGDVVVQSL